MPLPAASTLPKYIPELDGLRAVAVLLVLLFHLNLPWLSLGWTGVTLFFVLSGFLITGILLDSRGQPGNLRNFYARRVLRILPIYYLTLSAIMLAAGARGQDTADLPYYISYTQNYVLGLSGFDARFPMAFNHSWSLAVEEQFYLLWPLAVLGLERSQLAGLVSGLFALGILTRALILLTLHNPTLMSTPLPAQLEPLTLGAGLALLARSGLDCGVIARWSLIVAVASGAALYLMVRAIGLDNFWHPENWALSISNLPFPSLVALFWGGLLGVAVFGKTLLSPLLRVAFFRRIGKISYGIYMYHFPVYVACDNLLPALVSHYSAVPEKVALGAAKLCITYLLASLSWSLVESPLLALKRHFR